MDGVVIYGADLIKPEWALLPALSGYQCTFREWKCLAADLTSITAKILVVIVPEDQSRADELCEAITESTLPAPVFAVLPPDCPDALLRAVWRVTDDFVTLPLHGEELGARVDRLLGQGRRDSALMYDRLLREAGLTQLVGNDPAFRAVVAKLPLIARSNTPVLITGETGTGKEMCARAVHLLGPRRARPFVALDCGSLPDHLIENELFGHVRGAYTDAREDQKGLAAMADKGTLFLDEVDALSPAAQAKLLRFLQERTYKPLGSERFVHADVNIAAATNRDLDADVRSKEFRADLFYRLNVLRIHLPPLRERRGDIELLARHFLDGLGSQGVRKTLSPAALRKLARYHWPGNVRELYNAIQRAAALSEGSMILPEDICAGSEEAPGPAAPMRVAKASASESFERSYVETLLQKHAGNVTHAAREAGKDRRVFGRLIKKYNIAKS